MLQVEFPWCKVLFEGLSFKMANGHRYTPDYAVLGPNFVLLVEVKARGKNGFRQASYGRARLAYDQCKTEFPCFMFRWVEKHKGLWDEY